MTFGSLFSGVGGFELGFERAGLTCKWQVEINEFCRRVLAKHWPDVRRHDDVRTFPPTEAGDWRVDVVCGGDPCQGNSNAGSIWKRQHPDLGREFVRVVDALRPRVVVRENPYPSRPDAPWPWWRMRSELERLGYAVLPFRLRSCCLGADHRRDRVFLLAERADADTLDDGLQGRAAPAGAAGEVRGDTREQRLRVDTLAVVGSAVVPDSHGERLEGIDGFGLAAWNARRAGGGAGGAERRDDSLPAPRVCRSRHEVPDLVDRVAAIGNAVDPVVAEWIGRRLMEAV